MDLSRYDNVVKTVKLEVDGIKALSLVNVDKITLGQAAEKLAQLLDQQSIRNRDKIVALLMLQNSSPCDRAFKEEVRNDIVNANKEVNEIGATAKSIENAKSNEEVKELVAKAPH